MSIFRSTLKTLSVAALLIAASHVQAQTIAPISTDRYDDADEYLPVAQAKNTNGIRLFLQQQASENLVKVLTPRNVTVNVISHVPDDAEFGVVFLLGGTSVLSLKNEMLDRSFSFQPRSRDTWWSKKVATFLVDAPSDRLGREGIQDLRWRAGAEHRADLLAVLDAISQKLGKPLVVHGHSNGAVSIANIAGLNHNAVKAYVYSAAAHNNRVTTIVYEAVHTAPVIFVQHKNDSCTSSPTSAFDRLVQSVKAPAKKVLIVEGGVSPMSGACGPFAPHSFVGVETEAISNQIPLIREALGL